MNEKEMFLKVWKDEYERTLKLLKAYPANKGNLRPAEILRTAKELIEVFVGEQAVAEGAVKGQIDMSGQGPTFNTIPEVISAYEKNFTRLYDMVKAMPESDWNGTMDFFVGPKQPGKVRRADVLWLTVHDMIHHRGQLSIYMRIAGAKVPSIYGPSADEPWF